MIASNANPASSLSFALTFKLQGHKADFNCLIVPFTHLK